MKYTVDTILKLIEFQEPISSDDLKEILTSYQGYSFVFTPLEQELPSYVKHNEDSYSKSFYADCFCKTKLCNCNLK